MSRVADWKVCHCENAVNCRFNDEIDDDHGSEYNELEHSVCHGIGGCKDYKSSKYSIK